MRKSWLMCVLLGTLAWGQAAPSAPSKGIVGNVRPGEPTPQAAQAPVDNSSSECVQSRLPLRVQQQPGRPPPIARQ